MHNHFMCVGIIPSDSEDSELEESDSVLQNQVGGRVRRSGFSQCVWVQSVCGCIRGGESYI